MLDKVFVGVHVSKLDTGTPPQPVSRVTLVVDGTNSYTAGDDTGRTIEKSLPWASQAMAESVLRSLQNVTYIPFTVEDALLDPAAEIGDGVTAGGVYSTLARADIIFDGLYSADIAAPGGDEVEDEYPYKSRSQRQAARELAKIRSSITKTAESITLRVENEIDGLSGQLQLTASSLSAEIANTRDGLNAKIELTASSLTTEINSTRDGLNAKIELTASSLTSEINSTRDGLNSKIEQTASSLTSQIGTINGEVSQLQQTAYSLSSEISNAQGNISRIDQRVDSIGLSVDGSSLILTKDGVTVSHSIQAAGLLGNMIFLLDGMGRTAGMFYLTGASSYAGQKMVIDSGALEVTVGGAVFLNGNGTTLQIGGGRIQAAGDMIPNSANIYTCGSYGFPWRDIYSQDGTVSSSDKRGKADINYDMSRYSGLFDRLRPCSFLRTNGTSGRRHHGFIAQEVMEALKAEGMTGKDFAGYVEWKDGEESGCGLRYEELLAMCIDQIQKLKSRVNELEGGIVS